MRYGASARTSRRGVLTALGAVGLAALAGHADAQQPTEGGIIIVSRERILRESDVARKLRQAELALTAQLQTSVDAAKAALDAEEIELTRLRAELPSDEFENRAADFDQRIRLVRRETQERAAVLQRVFQEARARLVAALPAVLERLRTEHGAAIVLGADQVLAAGPGVDMTDRAIELFNAEGGEIEIPDLDLTAPLVPPASDGATSEQ